MAACPPSIAMKERSYGQIKSPFLSAPENSGEIYSAPPEFWRSVLFLFVYTTDSFRLLDRIGRQVTQNIDKIHRQQFFGPQQ